ncbi:MAG: DUF4185 domain-containing protein [Saprospiraceae bacterium]|nr:DUF4185 domain-containing protein [Saprospiraceae bacterium]
MGRDFLCLIFTVICLLQIDQNADAQNPGDPVPVYPPSGMITGIHFDVSTLKNVCPGNGQAADRSDNWTITWADDGHQYTSWGDGGGFGGDNQLGRSSMGIGRIEGGRNDYSGFNVWGGKDPESPSQFPGKCYGIISVDGTLYLWRSGTASVCYGKQALYSSDDNGRTWDSTEVVWDFPKMENHGFFVPTFLQFGQDYRQARDQYVYTYAPEHTRSVNQDTSDPQAGWDVNVPGKLVLFRVPKKSLTRKSTYEFYAGLKNNGKPRWTEDYQDHQPVFQDEHNGIMRTSVIYNPGLQRYIMVVQQVGRYKELQGRKAHMGIYEAPEPWGPWSTVLFAHPWELGDPPHLHNTSFPGDPKTVYWNFSPKWWFDQGRGFVMVYTGPGGDQWGTVEGHFEIAGK